MKQPTRPATGPTPEHSPLPWRAKPQGDKGASIVMANLASVAFIPEGLNAEANAEFIVTAVNTHAALLAACKAALQRCETAKRKFVGRWVGDDELMAQLAAAIAKTEGVAS